jgi:hypothetical protein
MVVVPPEAAAAGIDGEALPVTSIGLPVYMIAAPEWGITSCGDARAYAPGVLIWADGTWTLALTPACSSRCSL